MKLRQVLAIVILTCFHFAVAVVSANDAQAERAEEVSCGLHMVFDPQLPLRLGRQVTVTITLKPEFVDVIRNALLSTPDGRYLDAKNLGGGIWEAEFRVRVPRSNSPRIEFLGEGKKPNGAAVNCTVVKPVEVESPRLEVEIHGPARLDPGETGAYEVRIIGGNPPYRVLWDFHHDERTSYVLADQKSESQSYAWNVEGVKSIAVDVFCSGDHAYDSMETNVYPPKLWLEVDGPRALRPGEQGWWKIQLLSDIQLEDAEIYTHVVRWEKDVETHHSRRPPFHSFSHAFAKPGRYPVQFSVKDQKNRYHAKASIIIDVSTPPEQPSLSITSPDSVQKGRKSTWVIKASGGTPDYDFVIQWGDKTKEEIRDHGPDLTIDHAYLKAGEMNLRVRATDAAGTHSAWIHHSIRVAEDRAPASRVRFGQTSISVREGEPEARIEVIREGPAEESVTVLVETRDASAEAGKDYDTVRRALNWNKGKTDSKTIRIPIRDDGDAEGQENLLVILTGLTAGVALDQPNTVTVSIQDNDAAPVETQRAVFNLSEYRVDESAGAVVITVRRLGGTTGTFSVDFATQDASAEAGKDYHAVSRKLEWPPGDGRDRVISVRIIDDQEVEREETIHLQLGTPRNTSVNVAMDEGVEAVIRIADNDSEPVEPPRVVDCKLLKVLPVDVEIRPGETVTFRAIAYFDDNTRRDVTFDPATAWESGPVYTAPRQMRFSERIEVIARFGGRVGRAKLLVNPPSWSPPISDASDVNANVPLPGPADYTWYVLCETRAGEVSYSEHTDPARFAVMAGPFPGPRGAEAWITRSCPNWRCATDGRCAARPALGGSWRVLCDTHTGEITFSEHPADSLRFVVMAGGFLGQPDARLWLEQSCPSGRCTAKGACATTPAIDSLGRNTWYAICHKPSGAIRVGQKPLNPGEQVISPPLLGEPEARRWMELYCPSWLCDRFGRPIPSPVRQPSRQRTVIPPPGDRTGAEGAVPFGQGFAERGRSDGAAQPLRGEFVEIGSAEALALLDDAQRSWVASQLEKRGYSPEAVEDTMKRAMGNGPPLDFSQELAMLAGVFAKSIVILSGGHVPSGAQPEEAGAASGKTPGGWGSAFGDSGGPDCTKKFCPVCGDDEVVLLDVSADEQCEKCKKRYHRQIMDCLRGDSSANLPDQGVEHLEQYSLYACEKRHWHAGRKRHYTTSRYVCVGSGNPAPASCDNFVFIWGPATQAQCDMRKQDYQSYADKLGPVWH